MEDLVASVRAIYLTADEFQTDHNFSVRVVSPHGQQLIPRSWGFVADENADNFFQLLARLTTAGFLVSLDCRADRLKDRPVMLTFDVDSKDSKIEPDLPLLLALFHDALGGVLRGSDAILSFSRHVLVTQNISKPGSLHFYYYNIYAPLPAIRIAVRAVKEMIDEKLQECGLKLDTQPYVMGVLRYPHTYAFKSFPGQPDSRHVELGFFKGFSRLSHEEIQRNSPFVNCFDVDHNLVDGRLALFWALLHAAPQHRFVPIAPVKAARAVSVVEPEDEAEEANNAVDKSRMVLIDMMDNDVFFDWDVFRDLAPKHGKGQETFNYLTPRVAMLESMFVFKVRGPMCPRMTEKSFHELKTGAWNIDVPAGGGKRKDAKESVWKWYKLVCVQYHRVACHPYFPGDDCSLFDPHELNSWAGFVGYQHVTAADFKRVTMADLSADRDLQFFMWFFHQVICNKSTAIFYRLLVWIRCIFVQPGVPLGMIPVMIGAGGLGKSLLFSFLKNHVFGEHHSAVVEKADILAQRFNGFSDRLSVCFVDEASALNDQSLNALKFTSTSEGGRPVERKGKEVAFSGPPLSVFLAANDNKVALPMNERRFLGVACDDSYGSDRRPAEKEMIVMAWKNLLTDKQRCKHLAAMFLCLLVRFLDMAPFDADRNHQLMTPVYASMRKNGYSHFQQFWEECLTSVCNARPNHPFDGSISTKIVMNGAWALHIPFDAVRYHWYDFNSTNRGVKGKSTTLLADLAKVANVKMETKNNVVWITFPSHRRCMELFSDHCALIVDEAALKYEEHSIDDAAFFAKLSFFVEPARAPSSPSLLSSDDDNSLDTDSIFQSAGSSGSSSVSDLAGFEY